MGMDDPPAGSLVEDLFQDDAGLEASGRKVQGWTHSLHESHYASHCTRACREEYTAGCRHFSPALNTTRFRSFMCQCNGWSPGTFPLKNTLMSLHDHQPWQGSVSIFCARLRRGSQTLRCSIWPIPMLLPPSYHSTPPSCVQSTQ